MHDLQTIQEIERFAKRAGKFRRGENTVKRDARRLFKMVALFPSQAAALRRHGFDDLADSLERFACERTIWSPFQDCHVPRA